MARQNRVLPTGEIVADPARGAFMGNRGILHDDTGALTRRRWRLRGWVTCRLDFKGRRRSIAAPGHYTELFFHDEAVAFAAGHRPCAECRRADYTDFRAASGITGRIADFDAVLHAARVIPRKWAQRRHWAEASQLPDGSFVLLDNGTPALIHANCALPFADFAYGAAQKRPQGSVTVLTPPPLLDALRGGYRLHIAL